MGILDRNYQPLLYTQDYASVGDDGMDLARLDDFIVLTENYQPIRGSIRDCNGDVIKNSALVSNEILNSISLRDFTTYIFPDEDGNFYFSVSKSSQNTIPVAAYDVDSKTSSTLYDLYLKNTEVIDVSGFHICDEYDYYINYKIEDETYSFIHDVQAEATVVWDVFNYFLTANHTENGGTDNETSITGSGVGVFSAVEIAELKINVNNSQDNFSLECSEQCTYSMVIHKFSNDFMEGSIRNTGLKNEEVIGVFRVPGI